MFRNHTVHIQQSFYFSHHNFPPLFYRKCIDLDNPSKGFLFADDKLVVVNDDKKLEIKSLESGNTNIYSYEFLYDLYNIPEDIVPIVYNSFDDWFLMSFTLSDDTTLNLNWNPISGKCELQTLLQEYNPFLYLNRY